MKLPVFSFSLALAASAVALPAAHAATELIYGSWPPAPDYLNTTTLPQVFEAIATEGDGSVTWKLIAGGQLADAKGTLAAIKDGMMEGGLVIPIYAPNQVPALATLYSTVVPGSDPVAVAGAAIETMFLNCPECLAETRKLNAIPLGGFASSSYQLMCRTPVTSVADLQGKRVRATGGYGEMMNAAGAVPSSVTLTDAVGLLQRGSLDCVLGAAEWGKTYSYGDFAKNVTDYAFGVNGPAIGWMMNRRAWNKLTPEQKTLHLRQSARASAIHTIGNYVVRNGESLEEMVRDKGVQIVPANTADFDALIERYRVIERERNIAAGQRFGLKQPEVLLDNYAAAVERWRGLSEEIGNDPEVFAEVLWREVYSKVDVNAL